jgi:hypothetical protein
MKNILQNAAVILLATIFACADHFPADIVQGKVPIAKACCNARVFITDTVTLDASESEALDSVYYVWTPPNNYPMDIVITQKSILKFLPKKKGTFIFTLTVYSGSLSSKPSQVTITIVGAQFIVTRDQNRFTGDSVFNSIQKAVDAAQVGDTILIDKGGYHENVTIRGQKKNGLCLIGLDKKQSIIQGDLIPFTSTVLIDSVSRLSLQHLRITAAQPCGACGGIFADSCNQLSLTNLIIDSNNTEGIRFVDCQNVVIDSSLIARNMYNGIRLWRSQVSINNCTFENNGLLDGVINCDTITHKCDTMHVGAVRVDSYKSIITLTLDSFVNTNQGIYIGPFTGASITMENNYFVNVKGYCLWCDGTTNADVFSQNDFMRSFSTPIWCNGAKNITIQNDVVKNADTINAPDTHQKGLDIGGCVKGTISDNKIQGFSKGVIIKDSPLNIFGNIFTNNLIGICVYHTDSLLLRPNFQSGSPNVFSPHIDTIVYDCVP